MKKKLKKASAKTKREFKCESFGNRCSICGTYFDEDGVCSFGHELGQTYII
ncbi:MAG: hypothetical protein PWQ35_104 [Patescibacteria group bacterium]|nr:hypothetical protein [Patescibacteria group bacterium]